MIYLDYAATSYIKEECVYQEMDRLFRTMSVNAGRGTYPASRQAQKLIDETRAQIASQTGSMILQMSILPRRQLRRVI